MSEKLNYEECNRNFDALLKEFKAVAKKTLDKKKVDALLEKIESIKNLTGRQREAIVARCNHLLAGTYKVAIED